MSTDDWRVEYDARHAEQAQRQQRQKHDRAFAVHSKRGSAQIAETERLIDALDAAASRDPALETRVFKHWKALLKWDDRVRELAPTGSQVSHEHFAVRRRFQAAAEAYGSRFPESQKSRAR